MRIGIDCRLYNQAGVGRYIRNLIFELQNIDEGNQYYLFLRKEDFNYLAFKKNFHKVLANFNWYGFEEQFKLPDVLLAYKLDLVHFPLFNIPIFYPKKFVVTIHDTIHKHFKMKRATTLNLLSYWIKQAAYNFAFQNAISRSSKILTPSNFVKDQLIRMDGVDKSKILVTYEGVDSNIIKLAKNLSNKKINNTLKKFNIKQPYLFYVGNAHPHKNVEGLIKAFLILRKKYQYLSLILSGPNHFFWERLQKEFPNKDIIYTGYVTDEELVAFCKNAQAFVQPSFEEGFGIPVLEAMACGTPVVSSNAASLPEVGGETVVYFDPKDQDDMVEKISLVLNDNKLRKKLIDEGKKRFRQFSWERLAKQTLEVYRSCE